MRWTPAYALTENWRKLEAQLDAAEREADEQDEEGRPGLPASTQRETGMSEYESLRKDLDGIAGGMERHAAAVGIYTEAVSGEIKALWKDNAALRDELHALANRVETLTRARLTEPAETAARMVDERQS